MNERVDPELANASHLAVIGACIAHGLALLPIGLALAYRAIAGSEPIYHDLGIKLPYLTQLVFTLGDGGMAIVAGVVCVVGIVSACAGLGGGLLVSMLMLATQVWLAVAGAAAILIPLVAVIQTLVSQSTPATP